MTASGGTTQTTTAPYRSRRSVTDVIRRGFDNMLANWPLLLIRVAENFVFVAVAIGSVFLAMLPVIAAVIGNAALRNLQPMLESARRGDVDSFDPIPVIGALGSFVGANWWLIPYAFVVLTVVGVILVAVHSFVIAGVVRVLVDGNRAAGRSDEREAFGVFSADRWVGGATGFFRTVFWIYNIAYGVLGLFVLAPILVALILMLLLRDSPAAIVIGCLGLLLTLLLVVVSSILASLWSQKAIVISVARAVGASEALRAARLEIMSDFGRHLGTIVIMLVITLGTAGLFGSASLMFAIPGMHIPLVGFMLMPLRLLMSTLSGAVTATVSNWMLGSFVALTE